MARTTGSRPACSGVCGTWSAGRALAVPISATPGRARDTAPFSTTAMRGVTATVGSGDRGTAIIARSAPPPLSDHVTVGRAGPDGPDGSIGAGAALTGCQFASATVRVVTTMGGLRCGAPSTAGGATDVGLLRDGDATGSVLGAAPCCTGMARGCGCAGVTASAPARHVVTECSGVADATAGACGRAAIGGTSVPCAAGAKLVS